MIVHSKMPLATVPGAGDTVTPAATMPRPAKRTSAREPANSSKRFHRIDFLSGNRVGGLYPSLPLSSGAGQAY